MNGIEWYIKDKEAVLMPLEFSNEKLTASLITKKQIINELIQDEIISVCKESDIEAIKDNLKDGDYGNSYDKTRVKYYINVEYSDEIINPRFNPRIDKVDDVEELWRIIQLDEIYEFFYEKKEKNSFINKFNPKVESTFIGLLDNFSVSQIHNIINYKIKHFNDYHPNEVKTLNHKFNTILVSLRKYGEDVLAKQWHVNSYNRGENYKHSILSNIFFNNILPVEWNGYYSVCSQQLIDRYLQQILILEEDM